MVTIAVHGHAARLVEAEAAAVRLTVETEGDDRAAALRACALAQRELTDAIERLVEAGSVTRWSSAQVTTFVRRHDSVGERLAEPRHVAQAAVRAEFRDLNAVGVWLAAATEREAVSIEGLEWSVTDGTRHDVERELRIEAVAEAMRRAEDYAAALGTSGVEVLAMWEPGLRGSGGQESGWTAQAFGGSRRHSSPSFDLRPEPIGLAAAISLDVRAE